MYTFAALHRFKILPSTFLAMEQEERAFIMAAIDIIVEQEKKDAAAIRAKA